MEESQMEEIHSLIFRVNPLLFSQCSATMASEGLDDGDWEDEFWDELFQAEVKILSTRKTHQNNHLPTPTLSPSRPPPRLAVSYSPPRELSQRTRETRETSCITDSFPPPQTHITKDPEVDVLKKEFNRVSQRLNHLEEKCSVLRRERDEKEQQLKVLHPEVEAKDAGFHLARNNERFMHKIDPGGCVGVEVTCRWVFG
ncbi:hypothetical protein ACS0TY_011877 [Phlomoides rotata]